MPTWLIPALKAILPHIGTIVSATAPVFTKKSAEAAANQAAVLQQQITELQAAASANDAHVKELAEQLQAMVKALEETVALAERRHRRTQILGVVGVVCALLALGIAIYIFIAR